MSALLVGYARCSTDQQDLTAQRDGLLALGLETERIYVDHGLTGTNRERPGLREALAACRAGDTLVVTKLDRLARSLPGNQVQHYHARDDLADNRHTSQSRQSRGVAERVDEVRLQSGQGRPGSQARLEIAEVDNDLQGLSDAGHFDDISGASEVEQPCRS